jgi:hypothetical protein
MATDVNNLDAVLQDLGELTAARTSFERALTIDEAADGLTDTPFLLSSFVHNEQPQPAGAGRCTSAFPKVLRPLADRAAVG